jgi:O-antigen/teichoic acid export membrane protein
MATVPRPHGPPSIDPERGQHLLPREELKRRASAGVFIVGSRGLAILLLGFAGQVVLARLLTPADFGAVAIGLSFVMFVNLLADGGLGAGLIRRPEPPDRRELQALTALQVSVATGLALAAAAVAPLFGHVGWVTAVIVAATPLLALQIPGRIVLERALEYRRLAVVEVGQVLVFNAWAIGWVLAGAGVWGLASGTVTRSLVGVLAMAWASPAGLVWPRFSWRRIRHLVGFGVRFQAVTALWLVRDQGLNSAVAAVADVSTLGLVTIARRLLEVPNLFLQSMRRVSFPTMSQLVASKEDPAPLLERAIGLTAVGSGTVLTGLAAAAPGLVPGLFGEQWRAAAAVLPAACLGLGIAGAVSIACQAYLYAVGDASAVLRSGGWQAIALFGTTLPLLPPLGVRAVGVGWLVSYLVEAVTLGKPAASRTGARIGRALLPPATIGVLAGTCGWLITQSLGADLWSGLVGGSSAAVLFVLLLLTFRRTLLLESFRFGLSAVRAAGPSRSAPGDAGAVGAGPGQAAAHG